MVGAPTQGRATSDTATAWTGTPAVTNVVFRHAPRDHGRWSVQEGEARFEATAGVMGRL
ncbi:hypothetical protein GCM10010151_39140 [Actinoallomurus spadix]|uniref:Uncharacterized protein n=1 Tax=Actinoallomurus spadix TaxID=79912 RepID=A0ABN0WSL5_9ACTN